MPKLHSEKMLPRTMVGEISFNPLSRKFEVKTGAALIIVASRTDEEEIMGNKIDSSLLKHVLEKMGFTVAVLNNCDAKHKRDKTATYKDKVQTTILNWSKNKDGVLNDVDCLLVTFLTHGYKNMETSEEFVSIDEELISIKWIIEMFANDKCKDLLGKPKLFFFRLCRGEDTDASTIATYDVNKRSAQKDGVLSTTIANMSEFFMSYSSYEGYQSFLTRAGSLFIKTLVTSFLELIPLEEELHHIMIEVQGQIQKTYYEYKAGNEIIKENPIFKSSLTKKLYFQLREDKTK